MSGAPTRSNLLRLYRDYMRTAQSFSSYNFRTYFQRRSRDMFRSALLPEHVATSSPYSQSGNVTEPVSPSTLTSTPPTGLSSPATQDEMLKAWYDSARKDLAVLRRSALTNQMYAGEKLVVEQPRLVVGGGGAGGEAATGGSGQPVSGPQSGGGAPPSG
ncbi:hypothetical protein IE81DRAFT_320129 [Ceraceosorus guamensis]|uniref:Complex 1 LYR protein domain-containing protein n=1 Tax=Ceraceosorus guamensis TaxID=1522189 RepID=A0A316W9E3_9BASI|nr:hypothetical protein IE81DRAFT_320129 [Ceraceosorus guamensis]PWN45381.1 hypothetical protein IE81DRAFT_320129 [Ceraceosorus guamensis]